MNRFDQYRVREDLGLLTDMIRYSGRNQWFPAKELVVSQ